MSKKATLQLCFDEDKLMKVIKEFAPSLPAQQTRVN